MGGLACTVLFITQIDLFLGSVLPLPGVAIRRVEFVVITTPPELVTVAPGSGSVSDDAAGYQLYRYNTFDRKYPSKICTDAVDHFSDGSPEGAVYTLQYCYTLVSPGTHRSAQWLNTTAATLTRHPGH